MESVAAYRQLLAGLGVILLYSIFCQASPIAVRRDVACLDDVPSAVVPRDSMPNWQNPGDCLFSTMETQTSQCLLYCEHPVISVISNATYCCAAYRQCAEEDPQRIECDGFVDKSKEFQELALDLQMFQNDLSNAREITKLNLEEISAIASAITELPGLVAILNSTVENVWKSLDQLNQTTPEGDQ